MDDFAARLASKLSGADFEEVPVDIEEFVTSKDYCGLKELSHYQYQMVRAMSQIYRYDTLVALYGEKAAKARIKETCNEIVLQLGKGSGKDFTSTVAVSYVVYLLLCLRSPSSYFGYEEDDTIDIINIAINADQARRVFFNNFVTRIKKNPWFANKFQEKNNEIAFDKKITVYSGHSEREAFEGYNTIMVILDEIDGFPLKSTTDNEASKTAPALYKMYRASVTSRYPDQGKLVLLSWPRFKGSFIQQRYDALIMGEHEGQILYDNKDRKEVVLRSKTCRINEELPWDYPNNTIDIEWEEDHIHRYARARVFALRRPSWEVNPTKRIDNYVADFVSDYGDSLGRYACMPSNLSEGYFKNAQAIEDTFSRLNGVDEDGIFHPSFKPLDGVKYYIHVDLAQKHDHCAVAMSHVTGWVRMGQDEDLWPKVSVDAVRWWTPSKTKTVEFRWVIDYIKTLRRRGFDIELATFDRWNSHDTMRELEAVGIKTSVLSVAKKHYDDFIITMYDDRLRGPNEEILKTELGELREHNGKVDHPRKGSKDLADAVCGSIYNSIANTYNEVDDEVEVINRSDVLRRERDQRREEQAKKDHSGVIWAPPTPDYVQTTTVDTTDVEDFLAQLRAL